MPYTMKTLRSALATSEFAKRVFHEVCWSANAALFKFSPEVLARLRYRLAWGSWPDLSQPSRFDEKLLWLNLRWQPALKQMCADKLAMRTYVQEAKLGHLLPRLFGRYDSVDEIDFSALPDRFVLKCTHGCQCNIFCPDRSALDVADARRRLRKWMSTDYSRFQGELHYRGMRPRIICEEFLQDGEKPLPVDYKLYCFSGHVHCTLVCTGRIANGKAYYDYYDRAWRNKLPYDRSSLVNSRHIPQPPAYEEMLASAEVLSRPFPFVRVDFYSIQGQAVLGEMTFTPSGCIDTDLTGLAQNVLGKMIELPSVPAREAPDARRWHQTSSVV